MPIVRECEHCGKPFTTRYARFCSKLCANTHKRIPITERFWKYVNKTDSCWLWTGLTNHRGYGQIKVDHRTRSAHRLSYEMAYGPIPDELLVLHNCPGGDNPACVNPAHLWTGTHQDNMDDMARKGRAASGDRHGTHIHPESVARGERQGTHTHPESRPRGDRHGSRTHPERIPRGNTHPNAKVTEEIVRDIRRRFASGSATRAGLALEYGVAHRTINAIICGQNWSHVKD